MSNVLSAAELFTIWAQGLVEPVGMFVVLVATSTLLMKNSTDVDVTLIEKYVHDVDTDTPVLVRVSVPVFFVTPNHVVSASSFSKYIPLDVIGDTVHEFDSPILTVVFESFELSRTL